MKNQYVGDINDYRKYGLLRILSKLDKVRMAVCWMLTQDDQRSDGGKTAYLQKPDRWKDYDKELFDSLSQCLKDPKKRNVQWVKNAKILPDSTVFYSPWVPKNERKRKDYFSRLYKRLSAPPDSAPTCNLVFFDPDNGLEIKSKRRGRIGSCKYLYMDEIKRTFGRRFSLLIYQHFPREKRDLFIERRATELIELTQAKKVFSLRTGHTVFFLVPLPGFEDDFQGQCKKVTEVWGAEIQIACWPCLSNARMKL